MGTKHGYHGTPTYISWMSMKARCQNPRHPAYPYYGGRGIRVCREWQDFVGFLEDMGERPDGHELDRIDVNDDYKSSNCEWSTESVQQSRLRSNKFLEYDGKRLTYSQWARELGIEPNVIAARAHDGWSAEAILTTPVTQRSNP